VCVEREREREREYKLITSAYLRRCLLVEPSQPVLGVQVSVLIGMQFGNVGTEREGMHECERKREYAEGVQMLDVGR
jgi:hypothetical protein